VPGSRKEGKQEIRVWLAKQKDIRVIVDVGAGSATYPRLLGKDKYEYKAIEIWAPYIKQWKLKKYYSEIRVADIRYVILPKGDCIIFGDILEHLPKEDVLKVFERADRKYPHIILSVPLSKDDTPYPSEIHYGNWFETHKSGWTFEELDALTNWDMRLNLNGMGVFAK